MREGPILFTGPLVRKILADEKSQTRRLAKLTASGHVKEPGGHRRWHPGDPEAFQASPYGLAGDKLWVRERMCVVGVARLAERAASIRVRYEADGFMSAVLRYPERLKGDPQVGKCLAYGGYREASRITLEVTEVRVERLQSITTADIIAEGIEVPDVDYNVADDPRTLDFEREQWARKRFAELWNAINGKRDGASWEANPWCWAISFKRVRP